MGEAKPSCRMIAKILVLLSGLALCDAYIRSNSVSKSPPTWSTSYTVIGTLRLPYAEINEPFTGYYDEKANKSRVDYYGTTVKTYQVAGTGKGSGIEAWGTTYKIAPIFTKGKQQTGCFQVNGTNTTTVTIQPVLPDLTGFTLQPDEMQMLERNCSVWVNVTKVGQKKNVYTMYIDKDSLEPVRFEMMGYDTLLGSHYDKYYMDYHTYIKNVSDDAFTVNTTALKCGDFPGPGAEHGITMNPMAEYVNHKDSHIHDMFNHFKKRHGKQYKDASEEQKRKHQFRQNVRFIHSKNRAGLSYSLAVNHLADMSDTERAMMRGYRHSIGYNGGLPFNKYQYDLKSLPQYVDWRLFGAVTQVKDQAVCGSCWSFGTTGTIEGAHFLKYGQLLRLSQQELMDCSWDEGNNACDGGEDFRAYKWIMKNGGLSTEEEYGNGAYLAQDSVCVAKGAPTAAKVKGFVNVTSSDLQALKAALARHGPISVAIDASHKSLSFYANGVYYEPACGNKPDQLDHSVLAVGYGVLNGQNYWLVKNSWSTYWGNDGYVLMAQRDNNCGVATAATYVLM